MNAVDALFRRLRGQNRRAFIPFVTAGDPDLATTAALLRELAARGASLIEVGFPYSDPVADGPVIQASYTRALTRGTKVRAIFDAIAQLPREGIPPLVAMVSFAIVYRIGVSSFLDQCAAAGFSGLIIPDLPAAEAKDVFTATRSKGLDLVQLVAPTTPDARIERIAHTARSFLYYVSLTGVTGAEADLDKAGARATALKARTGKPVAIGFGIKTPAQAKKAALKADGVVVGSAVCAAIEAAKNPDDAVRAVRSLVLELRAACAR